MLFTSDNIYGIIVKIECLSQVVAQMKTDRRFKVVAFEGELEPIIMDMRTGMVSKSSIHIVVNTADMGCLVPLEVVDSGSIEYRLNLRGEPVAYFIYHYINMFGHICMLPLRGEQIKLLKNSKIISVITGK